MIHVHHRVTMNAEKEVFVCRGDYRQTKRTLSERFDYWPKATGAFGESASPDSPKITLLSAASLPAGRQVSLERVLVLQGRVGGKILLEPILP